MTLPKAAMIAEMMPYRASWMIARVSCRGVAPRVRLACLMRGSTFTMAEWQSAVTIGIARIVWAMIIAAGE